MSDLNGYINQRDELNQKIPAKIAAERQECFQSDSTGRTEGDRPLDCLLPAGAALSWWDKNAFDSEFKDEFRTFVDSESCIIENKFTLSRSCSRRAIRLLCLHP